MAITYHNVYRNECKTCKHKNRETCGPIICYNCGDYYCSDHRSKHTCDPVRVKRHYAAMEGANKRGENPRLTLPPYSEQLSDGFGLVDHDRI